MEPGETITQTAIRETKEETGIDIHIERLIGIYTNPNHIVAYQDGEARQQFSVCFQATPTGGTLDTSNNESTEVAWINTNTLNTLNIHPSIRLRIDHTLNQQPQPYID